MQKNLLRAFESIEMRFIFGIFFILLANDSKAFAEPQWFIHTDMSPPLITIFISVGLILFVVGLITDATINDTPIWLAGALLLGFGIVNSIAFESPFHAGFITSDVAKAVMIVLAAIAVRIMKKLFKDRA